MAEIKAVCISRKKGKKYSVKNILLEKDKGVEGDFHAQGGERQVSLLADESIEKMKEQGLMLQDGAFGENIITKGINLKTINIGQKIKIGDAEIQITKIGKECIARCEIYYQTGDCIMPKEGVFARITKSGKVKSGDPLSFSFLPD